MNTGKAFREKGTLLAQYQNIGNKKYIDTIFGRRKYYCLFW
ncbi:MAG: hypothetical protein QXT62_01365 [Thermoplasmata archaeon]